MTTLPLSSAQERIWFLQQYDPADTAYHVINFQQLTGALNVPAVTAAVAELVNRHDALRIRFLERDGVPRQEVVDHADVPFTEDDVRGLADPTPRLLELFAECDFRPFDLTAAPLMRVLLVRTGDDTWLIRVCLHHLVADGWSLTVLRRELASLYAGQPLAPLATSYAQHVVQRPPVDEAYWLDRLASAPVVTLPTDRPSPTLTHSAAQFAPLLGPGGPAMLTHPPGDDVAVVGSVLRTAVPADLPDAVARLARSKRCTPFMVWLAAYQLLIGRHAGQDDICVGTPVANRMSSGDEGLIGFFTHTVVLRGDLSGEQTFTELLRRTRDNAIAAYSRPEVPFERLRRVRGGAAPYETWFNMHSERSETHRVGWGPDVVASHPAPIGDTEAFALDRALSLMVDLWPRDDHLELAVIYDRARFDESTAASLTSRYFHLVAAVTADPDRLLETYSLLGPGEPGSIVDNRAAGTPSPATVIDMIIEQAGRTPDAPAVVWGDVTWSYATLIDEATRHARGVRRGTVVGVRRDRSPDLIAAVLGVLLGGAAYLPLDPALPDARVSLMLADSGATLLGEQPGEPVDQGLAYVIYTSGSTGTPKGVAVDHESLAARVRWMRDAYRLTPHDRVLQFASVAFDTHAEEVFPILAVGGTLVLPTVPSEELPDWLPTADVTVLDLPTAYWQRLVHDLPADAWPASLRLVILGGSQADESATAVWFDRLRGIELINTYGPTEATIVATATTVDGPGRPPIGFPLDGTAAYVLGPDRTPVPVGVPGELYLAGVGVARGYLGRPELTAERFLDDPFGPPGDRMFRTGDRARLRRDGQLEYLGRVDRQLKVRGYRIEPDEVEAALATHPDVAQSVVTVHDDDLVAYVEPVAGRTPDVRAHLAKTLPAYMVPGTVILLDRLPLNTSGKPDLAALPDPAQTAAQERPFVAPRTDAEDLVADVWAEVLGREKIGALDDFFELGGHSLLATRVLARLRTEAQVRLPLRVLFKTSTVEGVAAEVERLMMAEIDQLSDDEVARLLTTGEEVV